MPHGTMRPFRLSLLLSLMLACLPVCGMDLPRQALLGLALEQPEQGEMPGARVQEVIDGLTGSKLGVVEGDVVVAVGIQAAARC